MGKHEHTPFLRVHVIKKHSISTFSFRKCLNEKSKTFWQTISAQFISLSLLFLLFLFFLLFLEKENTILKRI